MKNDSGTGAPTRKTVYISHPGSGLARSNFPLRCEVEDGRIVRSLPFYIPDSVRLYEIKTSRGTFSRPRKELQMPLAFAAKRRIDTPNRVRYPLLRVDWNPDKPNPAGRGVSGYRRISWDEALDIVVGQIRRIHERYGSMEPVLVQADGHGQSGYLQTLHFWGHYLFDMIRKELGWGWWTQQVRNPDSWEGYYWGAKHVWGFNGSLGEPYQDAVWDDVLENAEMVIMSGNDPEATGFGMSGSIALEMPKWLRRAGIKIVAISPDLNHGGAKFADTWIPINPNTDAALYLAVAHVWIAEGTYDSAYVASHTTGFDEFEAHVRGHDDGTEKTPDWAAGITGIPARTIRALAREWARKKTTLAVYFGGPKIRGTYSHLAARAEAYVLAMQGLGSPGRQFLRTGVPSFYKKKLAQVPRYPDVDHHGLSFSTLIEYAIGKGPISPVHIPRTLVADAIQRPVEWQSTTAALIGTEDQFKKYKFPPGPDHPGIRMIWNENGSQPGSWGNGYDWLKALQSDNIDFVVGINPWLENDMIYSDLILPAQTSYEHEDLIVGQRCDIYGMFYQEAAIEPIGESKSDYEIHRLIGHRLGLQQVFPTVDEWLQRDYEKTIAFTKQGVSWEDFKERKVLIYDSPTWEEWQEIKKEHGYDHPHSGGLHWFWRDGAGLETPSGRIEFVSEEIRKKQPDSKERPPLARWMVHENSKCSPRSEAYPLTVMSNHPKYRFHVQGDDIDWIREVSKVRGPDGYLYEPCWISPVDAESRGISDGDIVAIENENGVVLAGAFITKRIIPGAVSIDHGARIDLALVGGKKVDRGGCINLISPKPADKYGAGRPIEIPEMNVTGFLVQIYRVDASAITSLDGPNLDHGSPYAEAAQ